MLEKLYKVSIIIIATFLVGFSLYIVISPTKAVSQLKPTNNFVVPESHEWEATSTSTNHTYLLYNKKTGEYKVIGNNGYNKYEVLGSYINR